MAVGLFFKMFASLISFRSCSVNKYPSKSTLLVLCYLYMFCFKTNFKNLYRKGTVCWRYFTLNHFANARDTERKMWGL